MLYFSLYLCFFFRQKTAYDMRISDWSSDVCSSDLHGPRAGIHQMPGMLGLGCAVRGGRNICGCDHLPQLFLVVTVSSVDRRARRVVGSGMFRPEKGVGQRDRCHNVQVAVLGDLRDRKSVVYGKSLSLRVGLVGRRIFKPNTETLTYRNSNY